jgi:hypothetical protein
MSDWHWGDRLLDEDVDLLTNPLLKFTTKLHHASALRDLLEVTAVKRETLFKTGTSVKRIRFHDLRATGMAFRGRQATSNSIQGRAHQLLNDAKLHP